MTHLEIDLLEMNEYNKQHVLAKDDNMDEIPRVEFPVFTYLKLHFTDTVTSASHSIDIRDCDEKLSNIVYRQNR